MHIVIADQLPASAVDLLASISGWTVDARSGRTPDVLGPDLQNADALIVRSATKVTSALLSQAPKLRVIARAGTGIDNVDLDAASARGILVMNAPGGNSVSVAEHALALMLSLARSVPVADSTMKKGVWDKKKLTGAELRGKTLGLVGLGRIGQEVAARARAFGMEIVAHDPFISEEVAKSLGIGLVDLETLCQTADYVSLHIPATTETRHLFGKARLAKCKKGIRIVNTARGELIDEAALADAIESGHVAGAALDVFEKEPPAEWRLAQKSVVAPAAGTVQDTFFVEGEWVPAGRPVASILPPGNVKARFYVPEAALATLKLGQAVQISCDGCAAPLRATLSYVSTQAEYAPPNLYSKESRAKLVFLAEARPDGASTLRPGQPVDVKLAK